MTNATNEVLRTLKFLGKEPPVNFTDDITISLSRANRIFQFTSNTVLSVTVTLPSAANNAGVWVTVANIAVGGCLVTLLPVNGQKIYGALGMSTADFLPLSVGSTITIVSDGTNWFATNGATIDGVVEVGGVDGAWYRKFQSGFVLMGGSSTMAANATTKTITLPLALKAGDWPVAVLTPLGSAGSPVVSLNNVNTTSFVACAVARNYDLMFSWHAFGYWR